MSKKSGKLVVGLSGSPRKNANTDLVVKEVLKGAAAAGAKTAFVRLADLDIAGCNACYACKKKSGCCIKDDMQGLYELLKKADSWVIGTPVYWFTMSAQLKCALDRLFAFGMDPGGVPTNGKKGAVITLCADPDVKEMGQPIFEAFSKSFDFLEMEFAGRLALRGVEKSKARAKWAGYGPASKMGARLAK